MQRQPRHGMDDVMGYLSHPPPLLNKSLVRRQTKPLTRLSLKFAAHYAAEDAHVTLSSL